MPAHTDSAWLPAQLAMHTSSFGHSLVTHSLCIVRLLVCWRVQAPQLEAASAVSRCCKVTHATHPHT